jgi:SagB-type dehydrogenase family enzyme
MDLLLVPAEILPMEPRALHGGDPIPQQSRGCIEGSRQGNAEERRIHGVELSRNRHHGALADAQRKRLPRGLRSPNDGGEDEIFAPGDGLGAANPQFSKAHDRDPSSSHPVDSPSFQICASELLYSMTARTDSDRVVVALLLLCLLLWPGCERSLNVAPKVSRESTQTDERVKLPAPERRGPLSLEEALARRRSQREFTPEPLTMKMLSQLLWAASGITDRDGHRTAPSAGALYPLEIYLATASSFYRYEPDGHQLSLRFERDLRREIRSAALDQEALLEAPAVFVFAAVYERTASRYGRARAERYVLLEAGHAAQNLLLQAVSLDLGAVPIGAFDDERLHRVLELPREERPLYLVPVGHLP